MCEFGFFAKDLLRQVEFHKPDDVIDFSISYLRFVQSNSHVVGTNFSYVLESIHNRKALVFNIMEGMRGFDHLGEISPSELHFLVEALCPGFPKNLILQAAMSTHEHCKGMFFGADSKYPIESLCRCVYCHILYDEWLKVIEELFDHNRGHAVEYVKIRTTVEDLSRKLPTSLHQPPISAFFIVMDEINSRNCDVTFDSFKRELFSSVPVLLELGMIERFGNDTI